jgi:hypothetical protein
MNILLFVLLGTKLRGGFFVRLASGQEGKVQKIQNNEKQNLLKISNNFA